MLCERAEELFSDFVDGSILPAMSVALQSHLNECDKCQKSVAATRVIWNTLDAAPTIEPPADFRALVWRKIDAAKAVRDFEARSAKPKFDWKSLFRMPTVAWAGAALVVLALAPVVVPGKQNAASMWPWSLFMSAKSSGSATAPLVIKDAVIGQHDGKSVVDLDISNGGTTAVTVDANIEGAVENTFVKLEIPASSHSVYHLTPLQSGISSKINVKLSWDESGTSKTQELSIK